MNLELDIDTYIKQIIEDLKLCTSGEELQEKARVYTEILNKWYTQLPYEKQLKIYQRYPGLISKYIVIGDKAYDILEGQDCENCVFGDLMSSKTVSKDMLLEDWPCDSEEGCKNHYRINGK